MMLWTPPDCEGPNRPATEATGSVGVSGIRRDRDQPVRERTTDSHMSLAEPGTLGRFLHGPDWAHHPLGQPDGWPQALRHALRLISGARLPMFVAWGPELALLYNRAFGEILGDSHPASLGRPMRDLWPDAIPLIDRVLAGETVLQDRVRMAVPRDGVAHDGWFDLSYSPLRVEDDQVFGVFCVCNEITEAVLGARRREALLTLDAQLRDLSDPEEIALRASAILGEVLVVDRVGYGDFDPATETLTVKRDWVRPGAASVAGVHRFADYGSYGAQLREGRPVAVADILADPDTADRAAAFAAIGVRAFLDVPVLEQGQTVGQMFVHAFAPRRWTADEVAFVRECGERTRTVIERRRAERALSDSQRELQQLADALPVLTAYVDREQRYRFVSRAYETWFPRLWSEGIVGRDIREVIGEAAYSGVRHHIDRVLGGQAAQFELLMPYAEGETRHVHVDYRPRIAPDGSVSGFYSLVQDITQAKRAEAALQESETRFRLMADGAPVMMWVTDATGFCSYLNRVWYEFTGQAPGTGEGFGWLDAVHPADRPMAERAFTRANAVEQDYRVEFRLRRSDGVYRWVLDAAAARFAPDGGFAGYIGSVIDIDERREAEARLAFSEEQLRLATEAAEIGLWDVDLVGDRLYWPARVRAMFGLRSDRDVTMADFYAGLHEEDAERTARAFAEAIDPSKRTLYDVEYRTVGLEDGVERWVAAKGRALFTSDGLSTRVVGTAIDITARKAGEARLQALNEHLEREVARQTAERNRVWEMSRDLLAVMGFDGHLKMINPAWEATLGRDRETLLALSFREQVHPDDHDRIAEMMRRLAAGEVVEQFEDRLLHADGTWRTLSWTLVPDGDVFYAVGRDVTEQNRVTSDLALAQDALRQSQKMEAMGQLTGGVAHDFNNLLTPIVGALDMLERKQLGGDRERRLIAGAMQSAERAKTLVQRLLAFARRQPLQPVPVDVGLLVRGMQDLIASTTGPKVRLQMAIEDDLPSALADPNQLEMAVLNLAVNARDAMPDGGTLTVSVRAAAASEPRAGLAPGDYLRLSVTDTGLGMDPATLARAVEPFFSTKGVGRGTGLGLSMVHGLASQLGGHLTLTSRVGEGTRIELWLPQTQAQARLHEARPQTLHQAGPDGLVLLVDDEVLVRESAADMLGELGYSVVEVGSAEAALERLDEGLRPDFIVTDHLMPGLSGTDLAGRIKSQWPALKVLIVSGYAETDGVAPDFARLTKPFRRSDLAAALASLA